MPAGDLKTNYTMKEMLTATDVMTLLDLGRSTLTKWQKNGTLTKHNIGKNVRFRRSEILKTLAKSRTPKIEGELRIGPNETILTKNEVLKILGISSSHLRKAQGTQNLPYYQLNCKLYFLKSEVEAAESSIKREIQISRRGSKGRFKLSSWTKR